MPRGLPRGSLLEVPKRPAPENLPTDQELVEHLHLAKSSYGAETLAQQLAALRHASRVTEAEALRERFFAHMWDVSFFMRLLKQRFSQWFNTIHSRKGTLWEERFRSVLVEGGDALQTVSLYVDLNPVRRTQGTDTRVKPSPLGIRSKCV
jgi:putative transposase